MECLFSSGSVAQGYSHERDATVTGVVQSRAWSGRATVAGVSNRDSPARGVLTPPRRGAPPAVTSAAELCHSHGRGAVTSVVQRCISHMYKLK